MCAVPGLTPEPSGALLREPAEPGGRVSQASVPRAEGAAHPDPGRAPDEIRGSARPFPRPAPPGR